VTARARAGGRALFPSGISVGPGGTPHGFRAMRRPPHRTRLLRVGPLHVRGGGGGAPRVVARPVARARSAVAEDACFVLDTEAAMFTYVGARAPLAARARATELASRLRFRERTCHAGACAHVQVGEGWDLADTRAFWAALEGGADGAGGADGVEEKADTEEAALAAQPVLYRIDDMQDELDVVEVHRGAGAPPALLDPSRCLVLDAGARVVVWKGRGATLDARVGAAELAGDLAAQRAGCEVVALPQEAPDVLFEEHFANCARWLVRALPPPARVAPPPPPAVRVSVRKMHSATIRSWLETGQAVRAANRMGPAVHHGALVDLKAWAIVNFQLEPVTEATVGHFVASRSYLVQCTYRADGLERHVINFWRGWACSHVESLVWQYDIRALMAAQIEAQTGCAPEQENVRQGKEPGHFLDLFDGRMIVHAAQDPEDAPAAPRARLYAVSGTSARRASCVEVPCGAASLNSGTCFLLLAPAEAVGAIQAEERAPEVLYLWLGHWAEAALREVAEHAAAAHCGSRRVVAVLEREEPRAFWRALSGRAGAAGERAHGCRGFAREAPWWRARLFGCKAAGAALAVREVFDFVQADLKPHKAMLLDDLTDVFLWVGPQCSAVVQRLATELARDYVRNAPDGRPRDLAVQVVAFGAEPPAFCALFPWWLAWPAPLCVELSAGAGGRTEEARPWRFGDNAKVLSLQRCALRPVATRQSNALDLIEWKAHERAKWRRWAKPFSPFRNTFFEKMGLAK
jgi:hypothetical protein